jgi:hypothetical protein
MKPAAVMKSDRRDGMGASGSKEGAGEVVERLALWSDERD